MKIFVQAKPKSKIEKVKQIDAANFAVWVKEPPADGRANKAVIKILADFLNIAPSRLTIISGHTAKKKVIEVR